MEREAKTPPAAGRDRGAATPLGAVALSVASSWGKGARASWRSSSGYGGPSRARATRPVYHAAGEERGSREARKPASAGTLEAGQDGVTVNAICPAYTRTPLVEAQIADQARAHGLSEDEVVGKVMLEPAAIKRLVEPEEVARVALCLASEDGRSITGSAYTIDLGWTAR